MGFFDLFKKRSKSLSKKITPSPLEIAQANELMRQLQECVDLVNTTTLPKTFWGRLHFSLDILLELQKYEKFDLFRESTPTRDYNKILVMMIRLQKLRNMLQKSLIVRNTNPSRKHSRILLLNLSPHIVE